MLHGEYLDGLRKIRSCRKVGKGASEIRVSDVVVIEEDVVPWHRWRLAVVMELMKVNDGYVRDAKVKVGKTKNIIWCPVNWLYPAEVCSSDPREQNLSHKKDTIDGEIYIQDNSKRTNCPKRDAVVVGELHRRLNDNDVDP